MTSANEDAADIRARRTEKQWRHEGRELTSTHAFWGALVGLHGAVAGLAGVLVGQKSFPESAFIVVGLLSLASMFLLAFLNSLSRRADNLRAKYFSVTSQKQWPDGFQKDKEDRVSKTAQDRYSSWQKPIEWIVMMLFLMNALVFGVAIICRS